MKKEATRIVTLAAAMLSACSFAEPIVLFTEGDPVPGMAGEFFDGFGTPVIDETGAVYFYGSWGIVSDSKGLWRLDSGALELLVQEATAIPGLGFEVEDINSYQVAPQGIGVGVWINTDALPPNTNTEAVVRVTDLGIVSVHHDGDPFPFDNGTMFIQSTTGLAVNNSGEVAIPVALGATNGGTSDDRALFVRSMTDRLLAREGAAQPGGGTYEGDCGNSQNYFCTPELNDDGNAVFRAEGGLFFHDGSGERAIIRYGDPAPFGGDVQGIGVARINAQGDVVFPTDAVGNSSLDSILIDRGGVLSSIALDGPAPATDGSTDGFFRTPVSSYIDITDTGTVCFSADTTDSGEGLFLYTGDSLVSIARRDDVDSEGDFIGPIGGGSDWIINSHDQVLFTASYTPTGSGPYFTALYLYTPGSGTERLVAVGDVVEGREVTRIFDLATGYGGAGALNDQGVGVIRVELEGEDTILGFGVGSEMCAADLNEDGSVDFFDVSALLTQSVDYNGDTSFDFFDISAFLQDLAAGCP